MAPEILATNLYLGRVVAVARQRKGWTQRDLSEATGIGTSLLWDIECGRTGITAVRRDALVKALNLTSAALDAPDFAILTPEERRLITKRRAAGPKRTRTPLLAGRLAPANAEIASC